MICWSEIYLICLVIFWIFSGPATEKDGCMSPLSLVVVAFFFFFSCQATARFEYRTKKVSGIPSTRNLLFIIWCIMLIIPCVVSLVPYDTTRGYYDNTHPLLWSNFHTGVTPSELHPHFWRQTTWFEYGIVFPVVLIVKLSWQRGRRGWKRRPKRQQKYINEILEINPPSWLCLRVPLSLVWRKSAGKIIPGGVLSCLLPGTPEYMVYGTGIHRTVCAPPVCDLSR